MNQALEDKHLRLSLLSYLERTGWQRVSSGPAGELWTSDPETESDVAAVPNRIGELSVEFAGAASRIAQKEHRDLGQVTDEIRHEFYDVQTYRIGDAFVEDDAAPLDSASIVLRSAQQILRAAGTTSRKPTANIGGNFSKAGDQVAARARLSHTRRGSFVLPIIMPVAGTRGDDSLFRGVMESIESVERVLTRTAALAIQTIDQSILRPAKVPSRLDLLDMVDLGVSRELVMAVKRVASSSGVGMLDTTFRWSPALQAGKVMPTRIAISSEASKLLDVIAADLRLAKPDPIEFVSGRVIDIRQIPDEPYGVIALRVLRGNRFSEVAVTVSASVTDEALDWMRRGLVVSARGVIERRPGQGLRMPQPQAVELLDEIVLKRKES